jgi:eukaryotic-like serine/threonine-protein kinase
MALTSTRRSTTTNRPYDLTARWMNAKGKFNGNTALNFASTPDIIGGNSGSPVINKNAEVVGIIFDGNIQSLPWRFQYEDVTGRSVSVDSRGIIEALRNIYGAGALADELIGGKAASTTAGIVHRDLKPENIFVTEDGRVKILDFGVAKLKHPENAGASGAVTLDTDAGTVLGTVGYMSPEQVRGRGVDHRSDIFALGATLYEVLSGKRAFHGDTPADTLSAILHADPPDLTETDRQVAPALERIVRHCLEKNPAERFQSARDVAFDLESLTVSGSSKLQVEPARHSRRWIWIGALALAFAAVLLGTFFLGRATTVKVESPRFHRLTFRRGSVRAARFAPDGQTIVYGGAWEGKPVELFTTRFDSIDSRPLELGAAQLLAISSNGEMAILVSPRNLAGFVQEGNLARVPLAGGAPREIADRAEWADWTSDGSSLAVVRTLSSRGDNLLESPPDNVIYRPEGWVSHVRFSPSGESIGFADHIAGGDDGRAVITDRNGKVRVRSAFYQSIQGLAWAPDGREVWFTAAPAGTARALYAMDLSGHERLVLRVPATLTLHDISRSGQVLLSKDDAQYGLVVMAPGAKVERNLSWFDWSILSDLSSDGRTALIGESGEAVGSTYGLFLRRTDGSPAVRLGNSTRGTFLPDERWVIGDDDAVPAQLQLLPTGVGQPRTLTNDRINHLRAAWHPDEKRIVFTGAEPGRPSRLFVLNPETGASQAITPEGISSLGIPGMGVSPDRKRILLTTGLRKYAVLSVEGGAITPIPGLLPQEEPVAWDPDGKYVLVRQQVLPVRIDRLDPDTGRREPFRTITPAEPAGVENLSGFKFASGGSYGYSYHRILSELYVIDGLK